MILLVLALAPVASGQQPPEPSDLAVTSVGAAVVAVPTLGQADVDLLFGQRLRWGVGEVTDGYNRLWFDGALTVDLLREVTWERTRLTRAGVELRRGPVLLDLGRAPVRYGGPRLVDGAQVLVGAAALKVGAWAGLAPDLFTTIPRLRPAAGPVVAWERPQIQASLVGEVALSEELLLDRAASLALARVTADRWLDVSARWDMDWVSPTLPEGAGGPHLADGRLLASIRPDATWRIDALYEAYSSLRYLQTEPLDPRLRRYQQRLLAYGIRWGITQDFQDPTLHHLVGGGVRWADRAGLGAVPRAGVDARYRYHPNPTNRFARVHGEFGVGEIPAAGFLDCALDGALVEVDSEVQVDSGVTVVWEPGDSRAWAMDASVRVLVAPAVYQGLGWYTDLFVDAVPDRTWLVAAGTFVSREPDPDFDDLGIGAFARVGAHLR